MRTIFTKKLTIWEIVKFGLTGGINTVLTFCIYSILVFFNVPYYIALIFDYVFAIFFSLLVNFRFTFNRREGITFRMVYRMAGTYGLLFLINEIFLFIFISKLHINNYLCQAIASIIIAGISYCMQRIFVFEIDKRKTNAS
ncbi:MAG: GtrA family protein [Spirochaetaceae bacterium]|nr:GtrA family protein [Spirochaetaceae bacterium]